MSRLLLRGSTHDVFGLVLLLSCHADYKDRLRKRALQLRVYEMHFVLLYDMPHS